MYVNIDEYVIFYPSEFKKMFYPLEVICCGVVLMHKTSYTFFKNWELVYVK